MAQELMSSKGFAHSDDNATPVDIRLKAHQISVKIP